MKFYNRELELKLLNDTQRIAFDNHSQMTVLDIANGRNTYPEIEKSMGETSIAGHLRRLEEDYELIAKKRPFLAKDHGSFI